MLDGGLVLKSYRALAGVAGAILPLARPFSAKLRAGLAGRHGWRERFASAADDLRGCVWFHVTSVGEYEQARPVIAALRERRGSADLKIAVTHFSPSGYDYARKRPCGDFHDYLPLDRRSDMRDVVAALQPRLLVFVKFDCWPNLVLAATERRVPVVLLAGTLQPRSARLWPVARPLFRNLFDRFTRLGVCTEGDRRRFAEDLRVRCPITVTGDTRAEQVIRRYETAASGAVAARLQGLGATLLILGSTWPPDERIWLPVLPGLCDRFADLRIVLVPHEPLEARLANLERELRRRGIGAVRLSQLLASHDAVPPERCILADSVGLLADVYRAGHLAYVGGSFTTGVHNTMEPAVAGLPVLFGPVIQNAVEAGVLVQQGAGFVVRTARQAADCATALLAEPVERAERGRRARDVVLSQRGATEKSLALLAPYL
jgi:3-deoxy-D-manno-octulosonic-acid transferase